MSGRDTGAEAARVPRLIEPVADLRRRLGTRHPVHRTMVAHGLALSSAQVPDGAEVALDGELESISDGIVLTATVSAPWTGECRRCLQPTSGELAAEVREIFESHPTEGDTWPLLHGDQIDLGPVMHEAVLLGLPLAPLCEDGCAGPAPDTFPAVVAGVAVADDDVDGVAEPAKDPRWAALDDLDLGS
jgi:DUF177 domain-containing protein